MAAAWVGKLTTAAAPAVELPILAVMDLAAACLTHAVEIVPAAAVLTRLAAAQTQLVAALMDVEVESAVVHQSVAGAHCWPAFVKHSTATISGTNAQVVVAALTAANGTIAHLAAANRAIATATTPAETMVALMADEPSWPKDIPPANFALKRNQGPCTVNR